MIARLICFLRGHRTQHRASFIVPAGYEWCLRCHHVIWTGAVDPNRHVPTAH